jgi:hypothetical protein
MSSFFSFIKPPSNAFGVKVTSVDGIPADLENVKKTIVGTNKKYREELSKYREIATFNQQLSKGYVKNLEAMVDVSRVLNQYIEVFNVLRDEFEKNERALGSSMSTIDISFLEQLTKSKIDELNTKFMSETEKLKKLYTQYGKHDEFTRVVEAQRNLLATTEVADSSYTKLKESIVASGGGKRKAPSTKTRQLLPSSANKNGKKTFKNVSRSSSNGRLREEKARKKT